MSDDEIIRRLVKGAYEMGWRNACDDVIQQKDDPKHPIGTRRRDDADAVLRVLDPYNLLGLVLGGRL